MGFINFVNNIFDSLRDFASTNTEFKCSQCIKCKQCIKTLSSGKQVRVFTCSSADSNVCNDEYINTLLPSVNEGITTEYLEAYNKNRQEIYNYLYKSPVIFEENAHPLSDNYSEPIKSFEELRNFYHAMECSNFRPFIDTNNCLADNDTLLRSNYPELSNFDDLSQQDKMRITHRYDW